MVKEHIRRQRQEYRQKNKEKLKAMHRAYYEKNKERLKEEARKLL